MVHPDEENAQNPEMRLGFNMERFLRNSADFQPPPEQDANATIIGQDGIKHEGNKNEPPLEWRLLTTESIENLDQAVEMIGCYEMRWKIEEFFKILKSDGLNIESTELTKGKCIRKLTIISMKISLKINF